MRDDYKAKLLPGVRSSSVGGASVQKRLQRARNFWLLVRKCGSSVLSAAPQVSVSKVDLLWLKDLMEHQREVLAIVQAAERTKTNALAPATKYDSSMAPRSSMRPA